LEDEIKCDQRHYWRRTFRPSFRDSITKGPTPCTRLLIDVYNKYNASAIPLEEVPIDKVERYNIISGSEVEKDIYKISELVEKPLGTRHHPTLQSWANTYSHQTYLTRSTKQNLELAVKSNLQMPLKTGFNIRSPIQR